MQNSDWRRAKALRYLNGNGQSNSRSPSGMTTKKATADAVTEL